ncbi:MAG TPA: biotin--[acetyl-CoA-carboxylase] ligase [Candidatus Solibacter sp.]|jgi:BirA family biotin operon repressor/biotin-[acetyl-CoA-carboxylase] ligase|nr:biotin--[acetyl-CoA-carboxylase] ligase [Candidatus Solibacter sp.]
MDDANQLEAELNGALWTTRLGRPARVFDTLGSTQDEARRQARAGAPEGTVVWALEQSAGRGRMQRSWASRKGAGLWFSVVLRPSGGAQAAALLSLAAGVGMARALDGPTGGRVRLKWPNDVLVGGRKLAGILSEAETQDGTVAFVIVGIGLNLDPGPEGFPPEIADVAIALSEVAPATVAPAMLMAAILAELESAFDTAAADRDELRRAWLEVSDTVGSDIRAELGGKVVSGRAVDLDVDGALVIDTGAGDLTRVHSGEVVHLRPDQK